MLFCCFLFIAEIARVRASLFQINGVKKEPLNLPDPEGPTVSLNEKVYVPVREHPDVSIQIRAFFTSSSRLFTLITSLVSIDLSKLNNKMGVCVGTTLARYGR